jgi:hypothetical protein
MALWIFLETTMYISMGNGGVNIAPSQGHSNMRANLSEI